jgi:hypothetical protein
MEEKETERERERDWGFVSFGVRDCAMQCSMKPAAKSLFKSE